MNNEPVAYIKLSKAMLPILVWNPEISVKYSSYVVINEDIPLYTHPIKELTDEEIEQVWTEVTCQELNVPYSFARAILRKAQEKCTK